MRKIFILCFLIGAAVLNTNAHSTKNVSAWQQTKPLTEKQKIEWLIAFIAKQEGSFIRNGSEYTPSQAAEHLRMKWQKAGDKIKTAQDFIKHLASSSSMSGKPYQILLKNGQKVNVGALLNAELKRISANDK
jgi:hypothetical protein